MPFDQDPRFALMGMADPQPAAEAARFYGSLPDMAFLQARGLMPQQQPVFADPFAAPGPGYVDPFSQPALDPMQQQRMYEDTILGGFKKIDPTSADFHSKLQSYFSDHQDPYASEYPRVRSAIESSLATHKNLQTIFSRSPKLRAYYGQIAGKMSPDLAIPMAEQISINEPKDVALRGEYHTAINDLLKAGKSIDAEEVSSQLAIKHGLASSGVDWRTLQKDGRLDPTEAALAIAKAKVGAPVLRPITDSEDKTLSKHLDALDAAKEYSPGEPEKKKLIDSGKAKDWVEADAILRKQEVERATTALRRKVSSYDSSNIAVPPDFYDAAGLPPRGYSFNAKGKPVRADGKVVEDTVDETIVPNAAPVAAPSKTDAAKPAARPTLKQLMERGAQPEPSVAPATFADPKMDDAMSSLEDTLKQGAGFDDDHIAALYRSIAADEKFNTKQVGTDRQGKKVFGEQSAIEHALQVAGIKPDDVAFTVATKARKPEPVTYAEILKSLSERRLREAGEFPATVAPKAAPVTLTPEHAALREKYNY